MVTPSDITDSSESVMRQTDIEHYSHSTWDEERPVTFNLLILRGLTVGGWLVAESVLLLSLLAVIWS
ncbi:MAG: hypothetical protein ABIR16_09000 [Dokdonella sp.]